MPGYSGRVSSPGVVRVFRDTCLTVLLVNCLALTGEISAQDELKGTVQVNAVAVSPATVAASGANCSTAAVRVAIDKRGMARDPTLLISLNERKSTPPELAPEIVPKRIRATVPGNSTFYFLVCSKDVGSVEVGATIQQVEPADSFAIIEPEVYTRARATITIVP